MEMMEFYEKVERHPDLAGESVSHGTTPSVVVRHKSGIATCLPIAAILRANWEIVEEVLLGKREPVVLQHMTRVVGYFSRIDNWNKSKIGELHDREHGNYALPVAG
ncbi:hypothetical protein FACS1894139_13120 [Planctomycetales bacterium]|nr:hypothetical protein FACS1894107_05110 [Planctomycetales bacterium]GHS99885.1 hypothetical protein FACS1894108_10740 [Planctomycetales bacterium]GHT06687.1 hypothetical protein FACS1894139_13120 [Planctomycetales bacterium]GHV20422.1 hypothetical protein AGMMS49959_07730 [Planctomycetales bacterium]